MHDEVRKDILAILQRANEILEQREPKDVIELRGLSDHTLHDISTYQDIDAVQIAVLIYALYKLLERGSPFSDASCQRLRKAMQDAYASLLAGKLGTYNEQVELMFALIRKIDERMRTYLDEVLDKARITKGSRLFEHGLSAKRAAEIMGVSEWELINYTGKTRIADRQPAGITTKRRLAHALKLFGVS